MTDDIIRGVDLSHHQNPHRLDFDRLSSTYGFAIIRATYGTESDRQTEAFVKGCRRAAMSVGLYHFFRADQNVTAQFAAFAEVAHQVKVGQPGDIRPTIDVEAFPVPGTNLKTWVQPKPSWVAKIDELNEQFEANWGGDSLHYLNGSDWLKLGKPKHWLARPLWFAHWDVKAPAVPDGWDWAIWQTGAALVDAYAVKAVIDQNVARRTAIPRVPHEWLAEHDRAFVEGMIAMTLRNGGFD